MTSLARVTLELSEARLDLDAALEGDNWTLIAFAWSRWHDAREKHRALLLPQDQT